MEYIVNNRVPISGNISDYDTLTPNNFLLGYKSRDVNIGDGMQTDQIDYCQKWKQVQNIANMYWNRWLEEYIPTLTPHSKWARQPRDFKISDLVTIKLKYIHIPPNHWPLGVVIEAFVGSNDIIRSVKVKTPSTELIRPSNSLCLLEASNTYK